MTSNPNYQSYLLRLWRDGADQPWRASLQSTASGEKFVFSEVHTFFVFLIEQLTADATAREQAEIAPLPPAQTTPASTED